MKLSRLLRLPMMSRWEMTRWEWWLGWVVLALYFFAAVTVLKVVADLLPPMPD